MNIAKLAQLTGAKGRGKRGGVRVIYYWLNQRGYIFLLDIYAKNEKEDLTCAEIKQRHARPQGKPIPCRYG